MTRKILEPIEIKGMKLKNRIGYGPILGMPVTGDGSVNSETVRWFEERAKGGVGFIMSGTLEAMTPDLYHAKAPVRMEKGASLEDDKFIPGWADLIKVIHSYDVKIGAQLSAPGPMFGEGPSPSPYPNAQAPAFGIFDLMAGKIVPVEEMSIERLQILKGTVVAAARRVKEAGFDCVELHCGHGGANLFSALHSPYYNRRTDQYGGSWENRLRFTVETIHAIRDVVGKDYPILVRISGDDLLGEQGVTLNDSTKYIVPAVEKAGVDCIDVTQGSVTHSTQGVSIPPYYPRGCFIQIAEAVKKATKLPVIGVGRILDLEMAERFLEEGKADIIYMTSQLAADFETPKKYFEGRQDEIRKCIGCKPVFCSTPCAINYDTVVNRIPLTSAETKKKVLVIGGGVGGMEAARIAAMRGHKVTLVEKEPELGGIVAALAEAKLTGEFKNIVTYLGTQMGKQKVDVRVCKEVTAADIDEMKPDVVIVACGSTMVIPDVVKGKLGVMDHLQACREWKAIGQKVVVWGLVAADLAVSLADEGKDVTMIGRGGPETIARHYPGPRQFYMMRKLTDIPLARIPGTESERVSNPRVLFGVGVKDFDAEGLKITVQGEDQVVPCDTLIISLNRTSNDSLFEQVKGKAPEVYNIGDCAKIGEIKDAIFQANEVARKI
jgi:2,4-dienoyl-CoA reductase-like NADH-dependent reductase (Old Yellow Enzyme family)/thioredoxin reductase